MTDTPQWSSGAVKPLRLLPVLLVALAIWFSPAPAGVDARAWRLLAIFVATIVGLIARPLPMGGVAMLAIAATSLTGTLTTQESFSGFGNSVIWLVVVAFFISRGFIKTGLGARIGYLFVAALGRKTLGLSYGLIATDLVLAPAIPSITARAGGVVFPIVKSLAEAYGSEPGKGTALKIGGFLTKTSFQGTLITSAMFLTAMAGNPLAVSLAGDLGIEITWGRWALAALVPGLVSLIVIPLLIHTLYPPEIKETPAATQLARDRLREMGRMKNTEWIMLGTFALLLFLWIFGDWLGGIGATSAALAGLGVLLVTGVLSWKDVCKEESAWDTLIWFSALVMMATHLNELGLTRWFSDTIGGAVEGIGWQFALIILSVSYFYSHYFFASNLAHISSMYAPFLAVAVAVGAPPLLAALLLAFFSNLFSCTTHYGTGPAPLFFGSGYVELGVWWKLGAVISVAHIVIWLGIGGLWWKLLGLW